MTKTQLIDAAQSHIDELMSWFPNRESVATWGGPRFRYPFDEDSFLEDVYWQRMPTYALVDTVGAMMGFGQLYQREERGHLARLIVSPLHRRKGLGKALVTQMSEQTRELYVCSEVSLFVRKINHDAIRCYTSVGFQKAPLPCSIDHDPSLNFMIYTLR